MFNLKQTKRTNRQIKTNKEAFTLIEIMMVVAIGALLMLIGVGGYRYLQRTKVTTTQSQLASLRTAIEMYKSQVGEYPQDAAELMTGPQNPKLRGGWGGVPLATEKELKDAWGRPFVFELNPKGSAEPYELYSTGATGEERFTGAQ